MKRADGASKDAMSFSLSGSLAKHFHMYDGSERSSVIFDRTAIPTSWPRKPYSSTCKPERGQTLNMYLYRSAHSSVVEKLGVGIKKGRKQRADLRPHEDSPLLSVSLFLPFPLSSTDPSTSTAFNTAEDESNICSSSQTS